VTKVTNVTARPLQRFWWHY